MKDYFIQIVLFLAGAVIGVVVPLLPKTTQKHVLCTRRYINKPRSCYGGSSETLMHNMRPSGIAILRAFTRWQAASACAWIVGAR